MCAAAQEIFAPNCQVLIANSLSTSCTRTKPELSRPLLQKLNALLTWFHHCGYHSNVYSCNWDASHRCSLSPEYPRCQVSTSNVSKFQLWRCLGQICLRDSHGVYCLHLHLRLHTPPHHHRDLLHQAHQDNSAEGKVVINSFTHIFQCSRSSYYFRKVYLAMMMMMMMIEKEKSR